MQKSPPRRTFAISGWFVPKPPFPGGRVTLIGRCRRGAFPDPHILREGEGPGDRRSNLPIGMPSLRSVERRGEKFRDLRGLVVEKRPGIDEHGVLLHQHDYGRVACSQLPFEPSR